MQGYGRTSRSCRTVDAGRTPARGDGAAETTQRQVGRSQRCRCMTQPPALPSGSTCGALTAARQQPGHGSASQGTRISIGWQLGGSPMRQPGAILPQQAQYLKAAFPALLIVSHDCNGPGEGQHQEPDQLEERVEQIEDQDSLDLVSSCRCRTRMTRSGSPAPVFPTPGYQPSSRPWRSPSASSGRAPAPRWPMSG